MNDQTTQRLSRDCEAEAHGACGWHRCECECHDDLGDFDIDNI